MVKSETIVLLDSKNVAHRFGHTHRGLSSNGRPTSVLFGVISGVLSLARKLPNTPFVFVWDGGGKTWRHELGDKQYKANRVHIVSRTKEEEQSRKDIYIQIPQLKEFCNNIGLRSFEVHGLEGDDLIGMLASEIIRKDLFQKVIIHSGDRDFYQLLSPRIQILKDQKEGRLRWVQPKEIEQDFGIKIQDYIKMRALCGDPGDNILKVCDGLGEKTAAKLVAQGLDGSAECYQDLPRAARKLFAEGIKIRGKAYSIKDNWEKIHTNYRLCRIVTDPADTCLSVEVRRQLKKTFSHLDRKHLLRDKESLTDSQWHWLSSYLADLDMQDLFARRGEIWALP